MSYRTIITDHSEDVATIRMNRPESRNALNAEMRRELIHAFGEAAAEARAVILTGMGGAFCAGQDLGDARRLGDLNLEQTLTEEYLPLIEAVAHCPIPTIAAVGGTAAGGGANIALAADICIAGQSASFLQAFARIGLIPDCGGTYWLPRRVGMARAMGLSLLAEPVTAAQAAEWGLIWEVVPNGELDGPRARDRREACRGTDRGLPAHKGSAPGQPEQRLRRPDGAGGAIPGRIGSDPRLP